MPLRLAGLGINRPHVGDDVVQVAAYAQDRIGPNRAGREFGIPFGLLQPLADGAKMLLKEDVIPAYVTRPLYLLAPMIAIIAATIMCWLSTRVPSQSKMINFNGLGIFAATESRERLVPGPVITM